MADFAANRGGRRLAARLICGSNWMLGYSHQTQAKDRLIKDLFDTPGKACRRDRGVRRAGCNAT